MLLRSAPSNKLNLINDLVWPLGIFSVCTVRSKFRFVTTICRSKLRLWKVCNTENFQLCCPEFVPALVWHHPSSCWFFNDPPEEKCLVSFGHIWEARLTIYASLCWRHPPRQVMMFTPMAPCVNTYAHTKVQDSLKNHLKMEGLKCHDRKHIAKTRP